MGHTIRRKIKILGHTARFSVVSKVGGYENVHGIYTISGERPSVCL